MASSDPTGEVLRPAITEATRQRLAAILAIGGDVAKHLKALAVSLKREDAAADLSFVLLAADLYAQGWSVLAREDGFVANPPASSATQGETVQDAKSRARRALLVGRDAQLREPSVREFIQDLQAKRNGHSIADLIDDGSDLSRQLATIARLPRNERAAELARVVAPVVQVIGPTDTDAGTGIKLAEAWRYFRHLWSLEYRATPGRTLQLVIRNSARRGAPIMAIASLASALPQLTLREGWLGWAPPELLSALRRDPSTWPQHRERLTRVIERARAEVRADDFQACLDSDAPEESLLSVAASANAERLAYLEDRGRTADGTVSLRSLPRTADGTVDWRAASESPLFRRKRAKLLADLIFAQRVLRDAEVFSDVEGLRRAVTIALREVRKRGLASRVVDLNVCGAVPPYGAILGGKLAALAVGSSEVTEAYRCRYAAQTSEIASQLAGRPIIRDASLCAVTTTSLYGASASQYNRLRVAIGLDDKVRTLCWDDLGLTAGFGTVHLSDQTVEALRTLATTTSGTRVVNNLFGEGPSPRLRQVRVGLECLRIPPDRILKHNAQRRVYGLLLSADARDALANDRPLANDAPLFRDIAAAWSSRWLESRIERSDVLARVAHEGPAFVQRSLEAEGTQLTLPFGL